MIKITRLDSSEDFPMLNTGTIVQEKERLFTGQLLQPEGQVTVHITCSGAEAVRIWRSTFLFPHHEGVRSKLLHTENIASYPDWTEVPAGGSVNFTLIFTPLPRDCKFFDLRECIPENGGFNIPRIERNEIDVYRLTVDYSR